MNTAWTITRALPLLAIGLIAGCSTQSITSPAPTGSTSASDSTVASSLASPASVGPLASSNPSAPMSPANSDQCSDSDLLVTNGNVESANTMRRVVVSFKNISSHPCTLVGYPGADLVTATGGLLIHIPRRPANAAHRLTLGTGDVATADIQASAIDTSGYGCHEGTLVVTPPGDFQSHTLNAGLPVCNTSISSVD